MATSPEVIEAWLNRNLRDSNRWKNADTQRIKEYVIKKLPIRPRFKYEPYTHQWACMGLGFMHKRYYFACDMGTGKSKIVTDLFRFQRRLKRARRMLVVVPNVMNLGQWREELRKHGDELTVTLLNAKTRVKRLEQWGDDSDVLVATYAGVRSMLMGKVQERKDGNGVPVYKKGIHILPKLIQQCIKELFDFYVLDEANNVGSISSKNFRMFKHIADKSDHYIYAMSGTLFGKDPQILWPQFYLLDGGWLLGKTLGMWRAAMFREQSTPWKTEYILRQSMRQKLNGMLRHLSIRYSEAECLDLPDRVGGIDNPMVISIDFASDQWKAYEAVVVEASQAWEDSQDARPDIYLQKRRICSGYQEHPILGTILFKTNPKADALCDLLKEIQDDFGKQEKVIIAHHYQATGRLIVDRLKQDGFVYREVRGGMSPKGLEQWLVDKNIPILVASKSAAMGLNLQVARRMIFWESPDAIDVRKQFERRIYRMGQDKVTYYYDLVMNRSVDEDILRALRTKKKVWEVVIEGELARRL